MYGQGHQSMDWWSLQAACLKFYKKASLSHDSMNKQTKNLIYHEQDNGSWTLRILGRLSSEDYLSFEVNSLSISNLEAQWPNKTLTETE